MTLSSLLRSHGASRARARAARWAGRFVLLGGLGVAVALFCERAGLPTPLRLPSFPHGAGEVDRTLWFLAVSFAGLAQGAFLLACVFAVALLVRHGGARLRPEAARVAATLDAALRTDRFSAALEARGPMAPLAERFALDHAPPPGLLATMPSRRRERWARIAVVALVLLIAVTPGTAPGAPGPAPVAGEPGGGSPDRALKLLLTGPKETYGPREPVPVHVIADAGAPPARDLALPVRIVLDDGPEIPTEATLFLPAGAPGTDAAALDLRALAGGLAPGEHRAVARAGDAESNVYRFRIDAPEGDADGPPPPPPPDPPPPQEQPRGGGPQQERPRFVEPLVREGSTVEKNARVPIQTPGGGAPKERTLEEAWPELERRREEALGRPGLSPAARKLIRDYFDRLRPGEAR